MQFWLPICKQLNQKPKIYHPTVGVNFSLFSKFFLSQRLSEHVECSFDNPSEIYIIKSLKLSAHFPKKKIQFQNFFFSFFYLKLFYLARVMHFWLTFRKFYIRNRRNFSQSLQSVINVFHNLSR